MEIKKNGNVFDVVADAEMFIIPNGAAKLEDFIVNRDKLKSIAVEMCHNNNGTEFNEEKDRFVELWMCSEDLDSDNLSCHAPSFEYEGVNYIMSFCNYNYIIDKLIDIKEGETISLKFNNMKLRGSECIANVTLNLTASQTKYRYRSFGNFQKALAAVCRR